MKNIGWYLFSFEGRITRSKYWLCLVIILLVAFVEGIVMGVTGTDTSPGSTGSGWFFLFQLPLMWAAIANGVKRCHDRNRSGLFVLVSLIPLVNLWYLVEVGFLAGKDENNEYGDVVNCPPAAPVRMLKPT